MSTASIDTSAIVRILVGDKSALKVLKLFREDMIFVLSDIALSETVYVLEKVYHKSRAEIGDLVLFFFAKFDSKLRYNRNLVELVFPFYMEHPKLSFNDCALGALAEIDEAEPLFTLDKKLARQHPSAKLLS